MNFGLDELIKEWRRLQLDKDAPASLQANESTFSSPVQPYETNLLLQQQQQQQQQKSQLGASKRERRKILTRIGNLDTLVGHELELMIFEAGEAGGGGVSASNNVTSASSTAAAEPSPSTFSGRIQSFLLKKSASTVISTSASASASQPPIQSAPSTPSISSSSFARKDSQTVAASKSSTLVALLQQALPSAAVSASSNDSLPDMEDAAQNDKATATTHPSSLERFVKQRESECQTLFQLCLNALYGLVDYSASEGVPVTSESEVLNRFSLMSECILFHGTKSLVGDKWSVFHRKRDIWGFVEQIGEQKSMSKDVKSLFASIKQLPGLKTVHGRIQALVRLSLMDRVFSEIFSFLLCRSEKGLNSGDYYESWAFIRSDYAKVYGGMLMSLDRIQFNLFIKGEELERVATPISANPIEDVFSYVNMILGGAMEISSETVTMSSRSASPDSELKKLLVTANQQISFLEENNRTLLKKIQGLKESSRKQSADNAVLTSNLNNALDLIKTHEVTNGALQYQIAQQYSKYEAQMEILGQELEGKKKDYEKQKLVLDEMSQALQRTVETEQRLRQQIEAELGIVRRKLQTEIETNVTLQKELNSLKSVKQ